MSRPERRAPSRVGEAVQAFASLPMFLVLTVIPWELAAGAWLSSRWLYERGWPLAGLSVGSLGVLIAAFTAAATVRFVYVWVGWMARAASGSDSGGEDIGY